MISQISSHCIPSHTLFSVLTEDLTLSVALLFDTKLFACRVAYEKCDKVFSLNVRSTMSQDYMQYILFLVITSFLIITSVFFAMTIQFSYGFTLARKFLYG